METERLLDEGEYIQAAMVSAEKLTQFIQQRVARLTAVVQEEAENGEMLTKPDIIREVAFIASMMTVEPFQNIYSKYSQTRLERDSQKDGKGIWKAMLDQRADIEIELAKNRALVVAGVGLDFKEFQNSFDIQCQNLGFRNEIDKFLSILENSACCFVRKEVSAEQGKNLIETQIAIYPTVKYKLGNVKDTIELRTKVTCDRASAKVGVLIPDFYHSRTTLFDDREIYNLVSRYQEIVNMDEEELREEERADQED